MHQDHVALQVGLVEGRLRAEAALKVLFAVDGVDAVTQKLRHAAADATSATCKTSIGSETEFFKSGNQEFKFELIVFLFLTHFFRTILLGKCSFEPNQKSIINYNIQTVDFFSNQDCQMFIF